VIAPVRCADKDASGCLDFVVNGLSGSETPLFLTESKKVQFESSTKSNMEGYF